MDNEYRSYSSTSYIKPEDRESKYKYQAVEPSKGKPPRFIAGETLEHSAHTSLFQFLFSVDSVLKSLIEREFPASSFLEKLKQLALSFNYSNDAAAILNLSSLLTYMSASLKSLKASPVEIFLFVIQEFRALRGFTEHRKPDSFFTLFNEDSPFIVVSSLSLREVDSWKTAIETAIGKTMMPAAFVVEMKWETEPNSEEIARTFKAMPQISQGRDEFEVSSWIGFNGHFYSPACIYSDKWVLYEEYGTNDNLSWLQVAWIAVSRNIRPVMLFFRQKREYKPTSQYIASTDFEKLLRFAQKKDEINRPYEQNFQKREEIERTPEQFYQKREELIKEPSYPKREEVSRPVNPLFQKREELNRTTDPYYQKKEDYSPYTQEIPAKREELNKSADIIPQKQEEYNLPYKQYTPNRFEQSKVPEYFSSREPYKKYEYPEPKREEYSRQSDSFRKEPPQEHLDSYRRPENNFSQENKYPPKSMSIDQSRERLAVERNVSALESPRLSYQESPRSYTQESPSKRDTSESTWTCKKCSKEGNSDTFECSSCRTINWDKFYEIKSKATPKPPSPQKIEDKSRYSVRDKKDDILSQSQFDSRESIYKPAFQTNENSFSRTFYGDVRENMYSTDSFDRKYNKEDMRNKQDVDLRASFQRKSDNSGLNRNASPKSLSALLEGGVTKPDTEYRGRERYKEDLDSSRKRNMSSNGFEGELAYSSIIKKPETSYNTSTARDEDIYSSRDAGKLRGVSSAAKISTERVKNPETLERSYGRTVTFGPDPDRPVLKDSVSAKDLSKAYSYKPPEPRSQPAEKPDSKWTCQECRTQNSSMFYLCSNCRKPRPKEFDLPSQKTEETLNRWTCVGCKSTNSMYSETCWKCKRQQLKQNVGNEIKVQENYVEEPRYTFPERGREFNYQSKLR